MVVMGEDLGVRDDEGAGDRQQRQVGKQQGARLPHKIPLKSLRNQTCAFEMFPVRSRWHVKEHITQGMYLLYFPFHDIFAPARTLTTN